MEETSQHPKTAACPVEGEAVDLWFYRLKRPRRSGQRRSVRWPALNRMLARFRVPPPRIMEKSGAGMPCQLELSLCQHLVNFPQKLLNPLAHARAS